MHTRVVMSEWLFSLRQDAHEGWDYIVSDDCVSVMQASQVEMVNRTHSVNKLDIWLNGSLWFEFIIRARSASHYCDYVGIIESETNRATYRNVMPVEHNRFYHDVDIPVLANASEIVDDQQRIVKRLRSVIRLKPLYLLSSLWLEVLGAASKATIISLFEDGEIDVIQNLDIRSRLQSELVGNVVKGISQVGSNISNRQTPFVPRGLPNFSPDGIAMFLHIEISRNALHLRTENPLDIGIKKVQMTMRPLGFENGVFKWIHELYPKHEGV